MMASTGLTVSVDMPLASQQEWFIIFEFQRSDGPNARFKLGACTLCEELPLCPTPHYITMCISFCSIDLLFEGARTALHSRDHNIQLCRLVVERSIQVEAIVTKRTSCHHSYWIKGLDCPHGGMGNLFSKSSPPATLVQAHRNPEDHEEQFVELVLDIGVREAAELLKWIELALCASPTSISWKFCRRLCRGYAHAQWRAGSSGSHIILLEGPSRPPSNTPSFCSRASAGSYGKPKTCSSTSSGMKSYPS